MEETYQTEATHLRDKLAEKDARIKELEEFVSDLSRCLSLSDRLDTSYWMDRVKEVNGCWL